MNQQPNPALRNTAIYVGNDAELRKKAIEYYEKNGYPYDQDKVFYEYIGTFYSEKDKGSSSFTYTMVIDYKKTIITLPTETESEYPCMMLVSLDKDRGYKPELVVGILNGLYCVKSETHTATFLAYPFAKPLPTTTLTVAELVEFYEKSNNVKVEVK